MNLKIKTLTTVRAGVIPFPDDPQGEAQKVANTIGIYDKNQRNITSFEHPDYSAKKVDWKLFREAWIGGTEFIKTYLQSYSRREDALDLENRRKMSYCPAIAKGAVSQVKNAIFQRFGEISRKNGPKNYQTACNGDEWGVDKHGSSMNTFIGKDILPEMVALGKIGVYIDKPPLQPNHNAIDEVGVRPYLYTYKCEDILAWSYNRFNQFQTLLLREHYLHTDPLYNLPLAWCDRYRYIQLVDNSYIETSYYNEKGEQVDQDNKISGETYIVNIPTIPFVIFELSESLLTDIAAYQVALLNLASSDMAYAVKANFPFYTEQYDPAGDTGLYKTGVMPDTRLNKDTAVVNQLLKNERNDTVPQEVEVGVVTGRKYPKGVDAPSFIHPSPEPLMASMSKQAQLKQEIREILSLSLSNITAGSVDIKDQDLRQGLEGGLHNIGMELEHGERQVSEIWAYYENSDTASISYPKTYSIKTDTERRAEAKEILALKSEIPSPNYQKEIAKDAIRILFQDKLASAKISEMETEVDGAKTMTCNYEEIQIDHEGGLVGDELASLARGYPKGEVEKAKKDKADRLALIQASQQTEGMLKNPASRGVSDLSPDTKIDTKTEKQASANSDGTITQRGKAA